MLRFCIVATSIVKRDRSRLVAEFVESSLVMWQSQLKPKKGEEDDYHGNFMSTIFEKWFSKLYQTLSATYGPCIIHMDGARYHKQIVKPTPTSANIKADIQK